jgi:hypothetical protein
LGAPPKAAPAVDVVAVGALPVIRSQSQELGDFADGLAQGLLPAYQVPGLVLVIVKDGYVLVEKKYGRADSATPLTLGRMERLPLALGTMQLVEQAKLLVGDNVASVKGDAGAPASVAEALTYQASKASEHLEKTIENKSGETWPAYAKVHLFEPLGMTHSAVSGEGLNTTGADMAALLRALTSGPNAAGDDTKTILQPETLALMEATHYTAHPALAGWAYGLAEMRRHGWRALQQDGSGKQTEARLVIVPETQTGYFVAITGTAPASFWRTIDAALFYRVFPPRQGGEGELRGTAAPNAQDAQKAAGIYWPDATNIGAAFLDAEPRALHVSGNGAGLKLSGTVEAKLEAQPGGYWHSDSPVLNAVWRDGVLHLGAIAYRPIGFFQRPVLYAVLAFWMALVTIGLRLSYTRLGLNQKTAYGLGAGFAGGSLLLILVALALWAVV